MTHCIDFLFNRLNCDMAQLRAPLDTVVEKARGFEPPRVILHCTCYPCPPGDGIPLGGKLPATVWEPPGYKSRPDKKYSKKSEKIKISKIQENIGSSHSWSSPLALDECVKQPKKTDKSPQVYDKSTYYINLAA